MSHVLTRGAERFCEWEFLIRVSSLTFLAGRFLSHRSLESFRITMPLISCGGSEDQAQKVWRGSPGPWDHSWCESSWGPDSPANRPA